MNEGFCLLDASPKPRVTSYPIKDGEKPIFRQKNSGVLTSVTPPPVQFFKAFSAFKTLIAAALRRSRTAIITAAGRNSKTYRQ
jgi:hypothetical protein